MSFLADLIFLFIETEATHSDVVVLVLIWIPLVCVT